VNAAHVGVEVSNGVVTLTGHVTNYAEKIHAEHAAVRVTGVKALAGAAEAALQSAMYFSPNEVKVEVEHGLITLSGNVEWDYQRQSSIAAVRQLMGVTGISDQIAIKPKASSVLVKSDIEAALKRRAHTDAPKISVDIQGSDVTLTGSVHSWSERILARDSAWGTPGVRSVVDKMTVS
jgi:VCBS repeat-containing protein